VVLGRRSVTDLPTLLIALAAVLALSRFKKLPEPLVVAAGAALGLLLRPLASHS
jgi:chromate transporter